MRGRRWTTGRTTSSSVTTIATAGTTATATATTITIMIVCRNWRWWGGGAEQPNHLFRWDWLLLAGTAIVSCRAGHRAGSAWNVRLWAHICSAARQRATLCGRWRRTTAGCVVVIVRRMWTLDNRIRGSWRRIVQTGSATQRAGAKSFPRIIFFFYFAK